MAPKKAAAKKAAEKGNKRKAADEVSEEVESQGGSTESGGEHATVAAPKTVLDAADIKRFKAHALYTSSRASVDSEIRGFASKALDLYANGTSEQKGRILDSFKKDKGYKWTSTFLEANTDTTTDKDKFARGWMTKFDLAAALNIPTHDKALFEELADAAVEGYQSKPHTNAGLAAKGVLLYDVPEFQVGGSSREHSSSQSKRFESTTDTAAGHLKKVVDGDEVKIKLEHPEFVALTAAAKLVDKGHKIMTRSLNAGRATAAKIKLFVRNETRDNVDAVRTQLDQFQEGMAVLENMELDVMTLIQLCKEVEKDARRALLSSRVAATW